MDRIKPCFLGFLILYFIIKKILKKNISILDNFFGFFRNRALIIAFIIAATATLGSLFFSEAAKYEQCELCWFQRIFMYPQAIILGVALLKKRGEISDYNLALSSIGVAIATYHYYISQIARQVSNTCSAAGISCASQYYTSYGYITIPMMSLTVFTLIIIFSSLKKTDNKKPTRK
ncbi:MAG: disulfide bond formation protein B [Candidatus Aenigmarchaeota archaeon CG_4_8_14_3_um_filter_37_24]|nr:MAG: disulfide bond formation protein B [Candidatus Aenigmarchaeota archaeon CG_4_8_14_3_um_filter_37_24]